MHAIKSCISQVGWNIPATVGAIRRKRVSIKALLHRLKNTLWEHVTGYRIEVTVQSATLQRARKIALRSGLLVIQTWLKAPSDELDPFKVVMKEIRVADYIQNVEWLLQRAEERK